jgi:histidyl-tRNA synthetase
MAGKPSYEDGHLAVAAVRVLSHRDPMPPRAEDIAEMLGLPPDFVRNLVVSLGHLGILKVLENPFEIRVELGDHTLLEGLPKGSEAPTIKDELDSFIQRKKREVEETEKMLSLDEIEKKKKEKLSKLEDEMKKMKGKSKPRPLPY